MDIYTDGSYNRKFAPEVAGWAVVFIKDQLPEKYIVDIVYGVVDAPDYVSMWNVGGEIFAAETAVDLAKNTYQQPSIRIFHDYYGILAWGNQLWKTNKPVTKSYKNLIHESRETMQIMFNHVKGHNGNQMNELADKYAGEGIREYKRTKQKIFRIQNLEIRK